MTEAERMAGARAYLSRGRSLRRAADRSAEAWAEWKARLTALGGGGRAEEWVRESPEAHRLELALARLEWAEAELNARLAAEAEFRAELLERLARVGEPTLRAVLTARYGAELPWARVAEELHFSPAHIYRLHRQGLLAFARANPELFQQDSL